MREKAKFSPKNADNVSDLSGGIIMGSATVKAITYRTKIGMLRSKLPLRTALRNILSRREFNSRDHMIINSLAKDKFVIYDKAILDEPELDNKIAEGPAACVIDIGRIKLCYPQTIKFIRGFKEKPLTEARSYKKSGVLLKLLSKTLPVDLRFKGYEVFNRAIDLDIRNGTNTYFNILRLSSIFSYDSQKYNRLITKLWFDPEHDVNEHILWKLNLLASGEGNYSDSNCTGYYNDRRFIGIVNAFLDANNLTRIKIVREPVIEKHPEINNLL